MDSMISLKSPGTYCLDVAIKDLLKNLSLQSFIEIGCGNGNLSKLLCQSGLKGCGVDVSAQAIAIAENKLKNFIDKQQYEKNSRADNTKDKYYRSDGHHFCQCEDKNNRGFDDIR